MQLYPPPPLFFLSFSFSCVVLRDFAGGFIFIFYFLPLPVVVSSLCLHMHPLRLCPVSRSRCVGICVGISPYVSVCVKGFSFLLSLH